MFDFIKWIVIIIIAFAAIGFVFSKDGNREEGAKVGAIMGGSFIINILPIVIVLFFVYLLIKACT